MTQTEIIFFDTTHNSVLGTCRAAISFFPLIIILGGLVSSIDGIGKLRKIMSVLLASLVLCSAIGVQLPKTYYQAGLYGLLVGLVAGACITSVEMINPNSTKAFVWAIVVLPIITSLLSLLTFRLATQFNLYPSL